MLMMAVWQGLQNDSISSGNTRLLMIFIGIVAFSLLAQAVVVILAAINASKALKQMLILTKELHIKAMPILNTTEDLIKDAAPKIKTISDNLLATSNVVKAKAQELESTLTDVNHKTKTQVARVDSMISTALTATGALAEMIHQGIKTPVTEALGVVNGFKAGINVLVSKSKGFANAGSIRRKTAMTVYEDDHTRA